MRTREELNNGGYTRWEHASLTQVKTFTKSEQNLPEFYAEEVLDGMGRVVQARKDLPNSAGYSAEKYVHYQMGRFWKQSNPTEIDVNWNPAGDNASTGFLYQEMKYDWLSRLVESINTDGTRRSRECLSGMPAVPELKS